MQEYFSHKESAELVCVLDDIGRKHSGRERVFDDWLTTMVCCLAGGTREEEYLHTIQPYVAGEKGKRDIDKFAELFARLVNVMEETRADILGDIFQGAITRGQNGQFFTPDDLCKLMVQLTVADGGREGEEKEEAPDAELAAIRSMFGKSIHDPCCGSGRLLLAAAKENPHGYFVGQDVDHRFAKITAINLALWNLYGKVIWGNSLTLDCKRIYYTGFNGKGAIRVEEPVPVEPSPRTLIVDAPPAPPLGEEKLQQGSLFDEVAE